LDVNQLKSIPLFQTVSDDELAEIAPFAEETTVEEGTELVREGDFSYEFFAIDDGRAEVARGGQRVAELGPGDFFGEIGVLERDLRTASVVAKTDMRLVTLTGWDMKRMEKAMPQAVERVREVLEQRRSES
jgi:CRP/FNR family transcriptional regulator, cyclic AMP receptor protein